MSPPSNYLASLFQFYPLPPPFILIIETPTLSRHDEEDVEGGDTEKATAVRKIMASTKAPLLGLLVCALVVLFGAVQATFPAWQPILIVVELGRLFV